MQLQVDEHALNFRGTGSLDDCSLPMLRVAAVVSSRDRVLWSGAGGKQLYHQNPNQPPEGDVTLDTPFAKFSNTKFVTCLWVAQTPQVVLRNRDI